MSKVKKYLIVLGIFVLTLILSGCGGKVNTTIKLNEDLSGERIMKVYFDKNENDKYIKGDSKTIAEVVKKSTPEQLEFKSEETENGYTYYFTMKFSSLEDYTDKVNKLLPEYNEAEIEFGQAASPFVKGISYKENFRTKQILDWFNDLMFESGYVDSSYTNYGIFGTENVELYYKDTLVSQKSDIYAMDLSTLEFNPINGIDVLTKYNEDFTISRSIIVKIPLATYDEKAKEIDDFFKERTVEGATGEGKTVDGSYIYTITLENANELQIDAMVNKFTNGRSSFTLKDKPGTPFAVIIDEENTEVEENTESNEEIANENTENDNEISEENEVIEPVQEYMNVFMLDKMIEEKWNLVDYVKDSYLKTDFSYFINNEINGSEIWDEYSIKNIQASDEYQGYDLFGRVNYATNANFNYRLKKSYEIDDLQIEVSIDNNGNLKKKLMLEFADTISENEFANLQSKLERQSVPTTIDLGRMEHSANGFSIYLIENLGYQNFNQTFDNWKFLTDTEAMSPELSLEKKGLFKKEILFYDRVFLGGFSEKPIKNVEYRVLNVGKVLDANSDRYGEMIGGDYVIKLNDFDAKNDSFLLQIYFERSTGGIILFGIGILLIVAIAILALIILSKRKKKKAIATTETQVIVDATTDSKHSDVPVQEEKSEADFETGEEGTVELDKDASDNKAGFCTNCGSKLEEGAKFCINCGNVIN